MHTYRSDLPRRICETMMHDPLYDETAPWERWALCIIAAIAVVAIGAYPGTSPRPRDHSGDGNGNPRGAVSMSTLGARGMPGMEDIPGNQLLR